MVTDETKQGRQRTSSMVPVAIGVTAGLVIPPSDRRVALVISSHPTSRITFGPDANVVIDSGFNLPVNADPIYLDIEHNGQLVQRGFYAVASVACTIGMIETQQDEV